MHASYFIPLSRETPCPPLLLPSLRPPSALNTSPSPPPALYPQHPSTPPIPHQPIPPLHNQRPQIPPRHTPLRLIHDTKKTPTPTTRQKPPLRLHLLKLTVCVPDTCTAHIPRDDLQLAETLRVDARGGDRHCHILTTPFLVTAIETARIGVVEE